MCPKYLLTRYYKRSSHYQILIYRSGEIKQYTKSSSLYRVCEYDYERYLDYVSNIYGAGEGISEPLSEILYNMLSDELFKHPATQIESLVISCR